MPGSARAELLNVLSSIQKTYRTSNTPGLECDRHHQYAVGRHGSVLSDATSWRAIRWR